LFLSYAICKISQGEEFNHGVLQLKLLGVTRRRKNSAQKMFLRQDFHRKAHRYCLRTYSHDKPVNLVDRFIVIFGGYFISVLIIKAFLPTRSSGQSS
jgi:hypothetical protein